MSPQRVTFCAQKLLRINCPSDCRIQFLFCFQQLIPYLVMDIFRFMPGIPGILVASAYSGTLR